MNTLKLTAITALILLTSVHTLKAQSISIKGGLSLSNVLDKDEDVTYSEDYKMQPGFHLGGLVDFPLNNTFAFQTGLNIDSRGFKIKMEDDLFDAKMEANINIYYISIPLTFKAQYTINDKVNLFGLAGGYASMGLYGHYKNKITFMGDSDTDTGDISMGDNSDDSVIRPDMGLSFGAGLTYNKLIFGVGYDLGLLNISSYQGHGQTNKNRSLKISVGWQFN